eukprot:c13537_g1_i1.p1 GENE.c13537_g1_i1~~c13537_g1_i1.p1  ORF type:complete len:193 (-),score=29.78 c13537_g1_i1:287-865(-)
MVEDLLWALGRAFDICCLHQYRTQYPSNPNLDLACVKVWRTALEEQNKNVALLSQIADLATLLELMNRGVKEGNFESCLSGFRLLSPLLVANHSTSYIYMWFEYLTQLQSLSPADYAVLSSTWTIFGKHERLEMDAMVEKVNQHIKKFLPHYMPNMLNRVRSVCARANSNFARKIQEIDGNFRDKSRLNRKL